MYYLIVSFMELDSSFTKEEGKKIQDFLLSNKEFKKNVTLVVTAWQLQKINTKNAVKLIKDELKKAEKRDVK